MYKTISERVVGIVRQYLFEKNHKDVRDTITKDLTNYHNGLVDAGGITDYIVVCDDTNNNQETIDRNELWVDISFKVTDESNYIYLPIRVRGMEKK